MKNIIVLAILVIITGTFAVNNSVLCQGQEKERKHFFSIGPHFGFVHGHVLEIVYPVNTPAELMSELKWDMKPLLYYGAQLDFSRISPVNRPDFFSSLSFKAGIPGITGKMEDRDWMSAENDNLTHFSSHDNETREFYWLDIAAGISLPVSSNLSLKPFFNTSWMHFSYAARDGYAIYSRIKTFDPPDYYPIDDNPTEYTFTGDNIYYTQDWIMLAAGCTLGIKLFADFALDLSFQISPLNICFDVDEHLARKIMFIDFTRFGLFLEVRGKLSYTISRFEFSYEYAYQYIGKTRGETFTTQDDGVYILAMNEAGAGLSLMDSRFAIKVRF